jgi:hypothetical protein
VRFSYAHAKRDCIAWAREKQTTYQEAEQVILEAMHQGTPSIKLLREARAESRRRIEKLRSQVSRAK